MTKVENYCGIDVSKSFFDVSFLCSQGCVSKKFAYTFDGMSDLLSILPGHIHCIMESTGTYHYKLAYFLHDHGIKLSVVNPLSVQRFSQALMLRTKTDKADSLMLMNYGAHFTPECWHPREKQYVELQELLTAGCLFEKQIRALKNQLESFQHSVIVNEVVVSTIESLLSLYNDKLRTIYKEAERLIEHHQNDNYKRLTQIPGMGKKTAIVLLTITAGMQGFDTAKQLSSYVGLCPRIVESGSSIKGRSKICKMGMSMIRRMLYMCALSAKKYNKGCKEIYERLINNGKKKKLALIAVANKLLRQAFSIIKNQDEYNEKYYPNIFAG